jgi:hypothetical protein
VIVDEEMVVVARDTVPVAYRLPVVKEVAEAIPSVEVPDINVEKVPVTNVGEETTAIVEVPDSRILDPAVK